jgi:cytochrome c551/c552
MKKAIILASLFTLILVIYSCGDNQPATTSGEQTAQASAPAATDDSKGIGPIQNVTLGSPLDQTMVAKGKDIYNLKCSACHKLDNTKLVGPGWKDVTKRRKPEWVMNFVTNVDEMLNKDPKAMAMLEECLVRMPNQNLSQDDARAIFEFMRQNDGEK